jgi:tripartite-type tricarboxylate transporter receptor subunit TctC
MPLSNARLSRRLAVVAAIAGLAVVAGSGAVRAQAWPDKPVRIVVAFSPGASTDAFSRALAAQLQAKFGQPFVVENRPGAGGWTGTQVVAQSKADGYTLTVNANTIAILGLIQKTNFDASTDLTPIAILARSPVALLIPNSLPVRTIPEFIAYAKANPDKTFYGSAGSGSTNHLYAELFNQRAGITMKHVPYKGLAEAMTDLAAGRVHMIFGTVASAAGLLKAGQVRLLAYGAGGKPDGAPDAPTVKESGLDYEAAVWWGLFAPGNLPADIRQKLNEATNVAVTNPEFVKLLQTAGAAPSQVTADAFTKEVKSVLTETKQIIDAAKITLE